jgi:predicted enzyme related to lactoylglutathione lyase
MPQPVVHFEIPADNPERLSEFYRELFGWEVEKRSGRGDYWLLHTRGGARAAIDGAMFRREHPHERPLNYVQVPSAEEYAARAERLGGRVILLRAAVPGVGHVAILADPEGNPIGLLELPRPEERAAPGASPAARRARRRGGPVKKGRRAKKGGRAAEGGAGRGRRG